VASMQNYSGTTSSDPRLAFILQGTGAAVGLNNITFVNGDDNPFWTYTITLDPGQTGIIMNLATGQPSKALSWAKATELSLAPAMVYTCMSAAEQGQVLNFMAGDLTVQFRSDSEGHLTGNDNQTVTSGGTTTKVWAVANPGYRFKSWTAPGGFRSRDNPLKVTNVTSSMIVTAHYELADVTYTVTFQPGAGGTLSGSSTQVVAAGDYAVPVTAVPAKGYHLWHWTGSDGLDSTVNPLTVGPVNSDLIFMAHFANEPPQVRIVSPEDGAVIGGVVHLLAEASDDSAIAQVMWRIDDQTPTPGTIASRHRSHRATSSLELDLDTTAFAGGVHTITCEVVDDGGLHAGASISVTIANVTLTLTGQRESQWAWIINRSGVKLHWQASNAAGAGLARFEIYRAAVGEASQRLTSVPVGSDPNAAMSYTDNTIDRTKTYRYWVVALDAGGAIVAGSATISL
jgi:hypothetical protein